MKSKFLFLSLAVLVALSLPVLAAEPMTEFPEPGVYVLHSEPSFRVTVGDQVELVTCRAELVLRTGKPYVTERGKRRVDLEIVSWKADGYSERMGGELHFRMLKDIEAKDASYVESYERYDSAAGSLDFPAHAQFSVPYELETPFGVISELYGLTAGTIEAFPPQAGALFKMEKGDTANLMAALMPQPISALSATGDVEPVEVTIQPLACADTEPD